MPKIISAYRLSRKVGTTPQVIKMPRRARITGMQLVAGERFLELHAEVEKDSDTAAFDTDAHQRAFSVCTRGDTVPSGGLVAFDQGIHVYEVQP